MEVQRPDPVRVFDEYTSVLDILNAFFLSSLKGDDPLLSQQ